MTSERRRRFPALGPKTLAIALTAAGLIVSPIAHGTDWYNSLTGNTFNNPFSSYLDTQILLRGQEQALQQSYERQSNDVPQPLAAPHRPLSATDFKPVHRGHPTADALVASIQGTYQREQLRMAIDAVFLRLGAVRANNIATSLAATIGGAQELVNDQALADDVFESLRAELNDALAGAPGYTKLPRAKKQALYEYLIFNTTVLALAKEAGKTDPDAKAAGATLANSILRQFGRAPTITQDR